MTIRYFDGRAVAGVLVSRAGDTIRVAMEGAQDVTEFANINGVWVSDDCDPATIEFAWQLHDRKKAVSEADCCCSRELAAWLFQSLFIGGWEDGIRVDASNEPQRLPVPSQLPF